MRVLILGGRAPVALDLARRFAARGATVHVADSVPCRVSTWSRAVRGAHTIAPPRHALVQFANDLAGIIATHAIDLVVPTCEEVFFVSRIRARLPARCNVFTAPFEQLRELHSKWRFLAVARDCGAVVPVSAHVESLEDARDWAAGRPVVLKPEYSRFGVHVRVYASGIPADAPALPCRGRWVVQEYQSGGELCSYSIAVKLTAHVAYEPRYRLGRSSSYYFEAVHDRDIRHFVTAFVAKIGFSGQISFDWIRSPSGAVSVLECNPRAISGVHLFSETDAVPDAMTAVAGAVLVPSAVTPRMLAPVMLSVGLPFALRRGLLGRWLADWRRADDVFCVAGDRKPLLGAAWDLASFAAVAARRRSSMRAASTYDIEWDGEELSA
jgi:predicted ATP-grasp superfamily ATP-dependent carboligase